MPRIRLLPALVAGCVALSSAPAPAQVRELVPPRILVIFDTSGSMAWKLDVNESTGGDGSRQPSENELAGARYQGRMIAETARKLHG